VVRRRVLALGALMVATLLLASVGSGSGAAPSAAQRAGVAGHAMGARRPLAKKRPGRHGCGKVCARGSLPFTGPSDEATCGEVPIEDGATVTDATTLQLPVIDLIPGELQVAAIVTAGGPVTPPPGWNAVHGSDRVTASGERLQVFYGIPIPVSNPPKKGPNYYSFTSPTPQAMTGMLSDYTGASQTVPINASAGAAGTVRSTKVSAPSITPSAANTMLVFVGAAGVSQTWQAPAGMRLVRENDGTAVTGPIVVAYQRWHSATETGRRTSPLSSRGEGIGDLIALTYPSPITCPQVKILNRSTSIKFGDQERETVPVMTASAGGRIAVRLKCVWRVPCVGDFRAFGSASGPFGFLEVASSRFVVPADRTRTVQIATCARGTSCWSSGTGAALRQGRVVDVDIYIVVVAANGQVVPAAAPGSPGELVLR
jgi:hypothetical protein